MIGMILWVVAAAVIAGLFARSAWTGRGPASRIVQYLYYRVGSLDDYQKSGREFSNARQVWESGGAPVLERIIGRIAPSQVGWFSARFPTDKGSWHGYLDLYDGLIAPYLRTPGVRLLEVGVKKGGSLVLWRELLHPDAWIFGIDINPDVPTFRRDAHMKVLVLDSTDAAAVRAALGDMTFDIIIDDGAHEPQEQWSTFVALSPYLSPTGTYIMEDVQRIDVRAYEERGMSVRVFPDRSGESLAVLFPPQSLALRRVAAAG
jgi:hypothetical protein